MRRKTLPETITSVSGVSSHHCYNVGNCIKIYSIISATVRVKSSLLALAGKDETFTVVAKDLCDHTVTQDVKITVENTVNIIFIFYQQCVIT